MRGIFPFSQQRGQVLRSGCLDFSCLGGALDAFVLNHLGDRTQPTGVTRALWVEGEGGGVELQGWPERRKRGLEMVKAQSSLQALPDER